MDDHDPQIAAEAAMKQAVRTDGPERQRCIELALGWLEIARMRTDSVGTGSLSVARWMAIASMRKQRSTSAKQY
jgi:hypothetical protein